MVTTKEVINVLNYFENYVVTTVQLLPAGFIRGYLMNDIDRQRPYRVIVQPSAENDSPSIGIWMTSVAKTQTRAVRKALERARVWLNYGCIGIDPRGTVSVRFQEDIGVSVSQLVLLLEKMTTFIRLFELQVSFYSMLGSGIHRTIVRQIMTNFYEWKDKSARLFGGVL